MPGIRSELGLVIAEALISEIRKTGSPGAGSYGVQAEVMSQDDFLCIIIENDERSDMTAAEYGSLLDKLQTIARDMGGRSNEIAAGE